MSPAPRGQNARNIALRYLFFTLGLLINSFGIAFITKSGLGTSQISSLPYVLSLRFPLSFGGFTFIMNTVFILIQIAIQRRNFPPVQLLQIAACIPFMLLRRSYAQINNPVGIEANLAFLGFGFVLMGLFNLTFLPMHYKNGYDLGKPFVVSSVVLFLAIVLLETLDHVVPYMKTVCESYAPAALVRQLPVLLGGVAVYALVTYLAFRTSAARFEQVDL